MWSFDRVVKRLRIRSTQLGNTRLQRWASLKNTVRTPAMKHLLWKWRGGLCSRSLTGNRKILIAANQSDHISGKTELFQKIDNRKNTTMITLIVACYRMSLTFGSVWEKLWFVLPINVARDVNFIRDIPLDLFLIIIFWFNFPCSWCWAAVEERGRSSSWLGSARCFHVLI